MSRDGVPDPGERLIYRRLVEEVADDVEAVSCAVWRAVGDTWVTVARSGRSDADLRGFFREPLDAQTCPPLADLLSTLQPVIVTDPRRMGFAPTVLQHHGIGATHLFPIFGNEGVRSFMQVDTPHGAALNPVEYGLVGALASAASARISLLGVRKLSPTVTEHHA